MKPAARRENIFLELFHTPNFRRFWGAGGLSSVGDQFDLIAFPWLALLLTGDPLAAGTVIAVSASPTVFFMLLGGSLVDRFSPRMIMLGSNGARLLLSAALAALILTGQVQLWLVYPFALLKGIADAFYFPSQGAMLPRIVPAARLRQANAVIHTTMELSGFVGPALAGGLIAFFSDSGGSAMVGGSLTGVGLAFAAVSCAFLFSAVLLAWVRLDESGKGTEETSFQDAGILRSIVQGIRFVRADTAMFTLFLLIAGIELLVEGVVIVGIPVLANTKLAEGALAVGVIYGVHSGGMLLGSLLAGTLAAPRRGFGLILIALFTLTGILIMPFGFLTSVGFGAVLSLIIGVAGGYTDTMFTTWLQWRTPQRMMGRVMSLLMVASIGLGPISHVVAGALLRLSLEGVFVGSGALMALLTLAVGLRREVRDIEMPAGAGDAAME